MKTFCVHKNTFNGNDGHPTKDVVWTAMMIIIIIIIGIIIIVIKATE